MFQTGNHEIIKESAAALPEALRLRFESSHEVLECLGTGRVTQVYLLKERSTGQLQALKFLNSRCRQDAVVRRRFSRVCVSLFGLRHEHILRVLQIAPLGFDEPYLLTRYHGRNSLADMLESYRALHESDVISIFYALARALHYAHEYGVVHGSLEPTDIFILRGDFLQLKPMLADFGMSQVGADFNSSTRGQALTGESFGNVRYMSPEQCRGELPSVKSDIYSFGCLMFEALSGRPAFALGSPLEVMLSHASGSSDFLIAQLAAHKISEPLVQIVSAMLSPQPGQRPASMGAVAARLKELMPPVVPANQKHLSAQSISAELKARRVSKQLSDTSGRMLLRGAIVPPLSKSPEPAAGAPGGLRPSPLAGYRDPARVKEQKQQSKIVRLQHVLEEPTPVQDSSVKPRLVLESDRQQPAAPVLVSSSEPKSSTAPLAPSAAVDQPGEPDSKPATLSEPYLIVLATVVAFVAVLASGGPLFDQLQRHSEQLRIQSQAEQFHRQAVELRETGGYYNLSAYLETLRHRYNARQRMVAVNGLSDMVGLNRTAYKPENIKFILRQPDNFALLVESGALEVDDEVRMGLVELVHFLAVDDIYAREYLMELLRANKHKDYNDFVVDASICPADQRHGKTMDALEVSLLKRLIVESNRSISQSIMQNMLASGVIPSVEGADALNELLQQGDRHKREFAKVMLQRSKGLVLLPLEPDDDR